MCLNIPRTMELVETVNRFPYPCRDRATVLRELGIIKPLGNLANLRDDWNKLVGRNCIEELAKCSEHKFLIHCRSTQIPQSGFSLSGIV